MLRPLLLALLIASPFTTAQAQPTAELARCLADNTSGKDRKDLARWVFFAMSAHPEMKPYASGITEALPETNQRIAALLTRLLAESCPAQTRATIAAGGNSGIETAFQSLGQLAMRELLADPSVNATMGAFTQHLDTKKLERAFGR